MIAVAEAKEPPVNAAKARADALALAAEAEAEAAEAEALAAAARARARAIRLRRAGETETTESAAVDEAPVDEAPDTQVVSTIANTAEATDTEQTAETERPAAPEPVKRRRQVPRLRIAALLIAASILCICALLGASGYMMWHHHDVTEQRQRAAAFTAAAKQGIVNMTSFDFNRAKEDVQRVIDTSTGEFRDDFQQRANDFTSVVQQSKVVTEGSVKSAAVESMGKDSAVVLVLAAERVTNAAGAKDEPREFRLRVTVARDGADLKMSKVEFVL